MPHFLIEKEYINNGFINLYDKELLNHLVLSLRINVGEAVKFIDKDENVYYSRILEVSKKEIIAKIEKVEKSSRKLNFELCAVICILKPEGMALAIQNATQAGAKEIYTVYSDNAAPKKESVMQKVSKWEKIAAESFKQCERADVPKLYDIMSFEEIFSKFKKENIIVFAEKYDTENLITACKNVDYKEKILAVFGPEGGFSEKEFEYFKKENLKLTTLGNLILKAPSAVSAGLFGINLAKEIL